MGSSVGLISSSSIILHRSMFNGSAYMYRRLCLLGDLATHWAGYFSSSPVLALTVSAKDTTGSETRIPAPFMYCSLKSLRQISRCNSPAPAMMCSPVLAVEHCTSGSDLDRRLRPSTSLGRSWALLGSTATRTTAATENFIVWNGWVSSLSQIVPDLSRNWSIP